MVYMEKPKTDEEVSGDADIFTVSRYKHVDLDSKLLSMVHKGKPKKEIDAVIKKMKLSCNYGGVYFKNYFRVDHSIQLTELGFFGPFEEKEAEYRVHVQMFAPRAFWTSNIFCMPCLFRKRVVQLLPESDSPKIAETRVKVSAKKQEIFYVGFSEPVYIEPGIWYLINFFLDGPSTLRCAETLLTASVSTSDTTIIFEFLAGSKQMPCMRFKPVKTKKTEFL